MESETATQLDRTYDLVLRTFVERGYAPHYTELARHFGVPPDQGRILLRDLLGTGLPLWAYPGSDLIVSFAPFNNLPTQYRLTVEDRQGWFGQCGFEALATCWVFPGKAVQIDAPCLDCGDPLRIVVRDGKLVSHDPDDIACYVDIPFSQWSKDWPLT